MSPRLASSRAAAIRWQGSKPSSLPSMASWRKLMMVRPLSVTSRTISARVGGWSSVLVWDSVANMCSTVTREGGWGQRGDGGEGVAVGCRARPLGTGLRRHDGDGESGGVGEGRWRLWWLTRPSLGPRSGSGTTELRATSLPGPGLLLDNGVIEYLPERVSDRGVFRGMLATVTANREWDRPPRLAVVG